MLRPRQVRRFRFALALAAGTALCAVATGQSSLPPTAPTAPLSATPASSDASTRAHRADVLYASGLLSINANNSSLNQILREIARQTGMKITGGVRDERVFGHYGPAAPETILATLIDGNSTNMVLRETASNAPAELILTPRSGGPSPPNPNAGGFDKNDNSDDDNDRPPPVQQRPTPQQRINPQPFGPSRGQSLTPNPGSVPPSIPQPANNVNGSPLNTSPTAATLPVTDSVPIDSVPTPSTTPPVRGIVGAPNPPAPGTVNPVETNPPAGTDTTTADPNSTNGVKTPEQIYQQLQELQKQRQQQQQPPGTITPQ